MLRPASVARLLGALAFALCALAALPASTHSARPMLIGFQDDPGFRWSPDRGAMITAAARAHATVIRATADWSQIAPTRPRLGIDAFDPAYNFTDLDDLTRTAAMNGMTVMLTIWGTPAWANDGRGPNYLPKHMRDLSDFAQAIAERYSGRHPATRSSATTRSGTSPTRSASSRLPTTPTGTRSRRTCTRSSAASFTAA